MTIVNEINTIHDTIPNCSHCTVDSFVLENEMTFILSIVHESIVGLFEHSETYTDVYMDNMRFFKFSY